MEVFDAIVADPPYGVRAGARKSVHTANRNRKPDRFCEYSRSRRVVLTAPSRRITQAPFAWHNCPLQLTSVQVLCLSMVSGVSVGSRRLCRDYYPATAPYTLGECLMDLVSTAARTLRIGGRLVYFLPVGPRRPRLYHVTSESVINHADQHGDVHPMHQ